MVLVNESESYQITFGNRNYNVPTGKFDVTKELGTYILGKAKMWDKKVYIHDDVKMKIEQVIVPQESKVVEESTTTTEIEKPEEVKDTDTVLKEAEEFLKGN